MRTNIASRLSLRAKFKSFDMVELCIIDSETGEIQLEWIPVTLGKDFPKQGVIPENPVTEEKEESANDANSDEDGGTQGK